MRPADLDATRVEVPPTTITRILVSGYKSLYDPIPLEITPLTILAGANSSGKSSAVQPLLLLKQTLESPHDPGDIQLDGAHVRFSTGEQVIPRTADRPAQQFRVKLDLLSGWTLENVFVWAKSSGLSLASTNYVFSLTRGNVKTLSVVPSLSDASIQSVLPGSPDFEYFVDRQRCFLLVRARPKGSPLPRWPLANMVGPNPEPFIRPLLSIIHLPGLRGNPERSYRVAVPGNYFSGTFEPYTAGLIKHWQDADDPRISQLSADLESLGLTWKVQVRSIDDTRVEVRVGRLHRSARGGAKDLVSIADVGFGVSQTLPVVVALRAASPGQLVYIEQPEIHLHPRAQQAMALLLADAARRGVRVVIETHSPTLLLAVQALVAEGQLAGDLVRLHWFARDSSGATRVESQSLDDRGAFGDWPVDFGTVEMALQDRYFSAFERRLAS